MMDTIEDIFNEQNQKNIDQRQKAAPDKAEFAARKKQERDALYELADEILNDMAVDGGVFQTYLDVQSRFDRYSVTNVALIAAQMPEATRLMDFDGWKNAGAYIRRGGQSISILEPGKEFTRENGSKGVYYNPKKVFDISQTNRQPGVPVKRDPKALVGALISRAPCKFVLTEALPEDQDVVYDYQREAILVRPGLDGDVYFRSVARELALVMMERSGQEYELPAFTAYCVSYMVSRRYGVPVDTYSFAHLPEVFREMSSKEFRGELAKMKAISGDMIADMNRAFEQQDKAKKVRDDGAR